MLKKERRLWLMNLPTALVLAVVILIAGAIVYKLVKDKKKGKSSCGCDCSSCGACCPYGTAEKQKNE